MDILKYKSSKIFDYLSRYSNFPYYYNSVDKKYIQGLGSQLSTDTSYVVIEIDQSTTLEYLSNKYYGRPDYWWIIADFNRIQDPFIELYPKFETLKIPGLAAIEYIEEAQR